MPKCPQWGCKFVAVTLSMLSDHLFYVHDVDDEADDE